MNNWSIGLIPISGAINEYMAFSEYIIINR